MISGQLSLCTLPHSLCKFVRDTYAIRQLWIRLQLTRQPVTFDGTIHHNVYNISMVRIERIRRSHSLGKNLRGGATGCGKSHCFYNRGGKMRYGGIGWSGKTVPFDKFCFPWARVSWGYLRPANRTTIVSRHHWSRQKPPFSQSTHWLINSNNVANEARGGQLSVRGRSGRGELDWIPENRAWADANQVDIEFL